MTPPVTPEGGEREGVALSGAMLRTLLSLFPDGCDVVAGRLPDQVHAQALDGTRGALVGGAVPDTDPPAAGCLGISRATYFALPDGDELERSS